MKASCRKTSLCAFAALLFALIPARVRTENSLPPDTIVVSNGYVTGQITSDTGVTYLIDMSIPDDPYPAQSLTVEYMRFTEREVMDALQAIGQSGAGFLHTDNNGFRFDGDWQIDANSDISHEDAAAQAVSIGLAFFDAMGICVDRVPKSIARPYEFDDSAQSYWIFSSEPHAYSEYYRSLFNSPRRQRTRPEQHEYTSVDFAVLLDGMRLTDNPAYPSDYDDEPDAKVGFSVIARVIVSDSGVLVEAVADNIPRVVSRDPVGPLPDWETYLRDTIRSLEVWPNSYDEYTFFNGNIDKEVTVYARQPVVTGILPELKAVSPFKWIPTWTVTLEETLRTDESPLPALDLPETSSSNGLTVADGRVNGQIISNNGVTYLVDMPIPVAPSPTEKLTVEYRRFSEDEVRSALRAAGQSGEGTVTLYDGDDNTGFEFTGDWDAEPSANLSVTDAAEQAISIGIVFFDALGIEYQHESAQTRRAYEYDDSNLEFWHYMSEPEAYSEYLRAYYYSPRYGRLAAEKPGYTSVSFEAMLDGMCLDSRTGYPVDDPYDPDTVENVPISLAIIVSDRGQIVYAQARYIPYIVSREEIAPMEDWREYLTRFYKNFDALPQDYEERTFFMDSIGMEVTFYEFQSVILELAPLLQCSSHNEWAPVWATATGAYYPHDGWQSPRQSLQLTHWPD